jgi:uncharacterized membrane protein
MHKIVVISGAALLIIGAILFFTGFVGLATQSSNIACSNSYGACPYTCTGTICSNFTYALQQGNSQLSFQQQASSLFASWVALVLGAILGFVGLIILVIGFILKPSQRGATAAAQAYYQSITCPKCGLVQTVTPNEKFCRNCGGLLF